MTVQAVGCAACKFLEFTFPLIRKYYMKLNPFFYRAGLSFVLRFPIQEALLFPIQKEATCYLKLRGVIEVDSKWSPASPRRH